MARSWPTNQSRGLLSLKKAAFTLVISPGLMLKVSVGTKMLIPVIPTKALGQKAYPMVKAQKAIKMEISTKARLCTGKNSAMGPINLQMGRSTKGPFTIIKAMAKVA
jgi:hypothetical protein